MNGSLATRTLRIEPPRTWQAIDLPELWRYRELLYFFVWRDSKVRYKQTVLGAAWAIIQPLSTTLLFTVIFGVLGGMSKQVQGPYALHGTAAANGCTANDRYARSTCSTRSPCRIIALLPGRYRPAG